VLTFKGVYEQMNTDFTEYIFNNRNKFMEKIADNTVAILFSGAPRRKSADGFYPFLANRNFFYVTGITQERSALVIKKLNGKIIKLSLYVKARDMKSERWNGKTLSISEAGSISKIYDVSYTESFESEIRKLLDSWEGTISVDKDALNVSEGWFLGFLNDYFPDNEIIDVFPLMSELRMIKSEYEIKMIKKAIEFVDKGIREIYKNARVGMYEYELAADFAYILAKSGLGCPAFDSIVAAGDNFNYLHYPQLDAKIKENDLILIDVGATYGGLNSDISRAFPVSGKFSKKQLLVYNIVSKCQQIAFEFIKPGVYIKEINEECKKCAANELISLGLINDYEDVSKYYWHNVSHHLGLDVHDICSRDIILQPGMVITVEPGVYVSEWGVGLRIEDDVLVTETGCDVLSKDIPRKAEEIEDMMENFSIN